MSRYLQHDITNSLIPGLNELWAESLGDPRICVAVLDGPVDLSHPSLATANITQIETLVSGVVDQGPASQHGTHIASIIFGQHDGPVKGIAPHCRGLIIPVFKDDGAGSIAACSQLDLARAISEAMQEDAHIINISGGELTPSGTAHPILTDAIRHCSNSGVLIVAAAGNEGCDCLHIPGALPSVLTVGAMSAQGEPLDFSNWGERYRTQGILAPGENILCASSGGETGRNSGTSYATAVVSGIAALLLSLQLKHEQKPDPHAVRAALLNSAVGCGEGLALDRRQVLAGRLNVSGAISQIVKEVSIVSESNETHEYTPSGASEDSGLTTPAIQQPHAQTSHSSKSPYPPVSEPSSRRNANLLPQGSVVASNITAAACECGGGGGAPPQVVFAIGQLGCDFGTEARRDSIMQHMDQPAIPQEPNQLLAYLAKNPWDAAAILWTLNLNSTPIYAMQGQGAFAIDTYQRLREFLSEQAKGEVERVSISGYIAGNARLLTGQVVPIIWPVLRGMYSWNTTALIAAVAATADSEEAKGVANFLLRVYEELRNLGVTPQDRAINYAATNAFQVTEVFKDAIKEGMDLDTIEVERSPICRVDSDCWDVKLTFFSPTKVFERARKVYRFTVDVSDVVPVMVGPVRPWFVR